MSKENELKKELEALKKRVADLESKPRIEYHYHYSQPYWYVYPTYPTPYSPTPYWGQTHWYFTSGQALNTSNNSNNQYTCAVPSYTLTNS